MVRTPHKTSPLPAADEMAFGIVVTEQYGELSALLLEGAVRTLKEAGCLEHNIQIKTVPSLMSLTMATQFFAEYTDVDAVILVGCLPKGEADNALLGPIAQNILQIQLQWNMPCAWAVMESKEYGGIYEMSEHGAAAAQEAVRMVRLQIDMEAASPNTNPDRRNLN